MFFASFGYLQHVMLEESVGFSTAFALKKACCVPLGFEENPSVNNSLGGRSVVLGPGLTSAACLARIERKDHLSR